MGSHLKHIMVQNQMMDLGGRSLPVASGLQSIRLCTRQDLKDEQDIVVLITKR